MFYSVLHCPVQVPESTCTFPVTVIVADLALDLRCESDVFWFLFIWALQSGSSFFVLLLIRRLSHFHNRNFSQPFQFWQRTVYKPSENSAIFLSQYHNFCRLFPQGQIFTPYVLFKAKRNYKTSFAHIQTLFLHIESNEVLLCIIAHGYKYYVYSYQTYVD